MNSNERPDALLDALARLSTHAPRPSRDSRTRDRCHAAMKPAAAVQARPPARASSRVLDRLLPAAVVVYALVAAAAAIRLGWLTAG